MDDDDILRGPDPFPLVGLRQPVRSRKVLRELVAKSQQIFRPRHKIQEELRQHPERAKDLEEQLRQLDEELERSDQVDEAAAAPTPDDVVGADLVRMGFPADFWLPYRLAEKWQSVPFPLEPTLKHVEQWFAFCDRAHARGKKERLWDGLKPTETIAAKRDHDLDLIRQFNPALVRSDAPAPATATPPDPNPFRHGPDFRSVHWFGTDYLFTATQAACVKVLWEAWENGTPEVGEPTILELAGSDGKKLRDAFKSGNTLHAAWNTLIVSEQKGAYRLKERE